MKTLIEDKIKNLVKEALDDEILDNEDLNYIKEVAQKEYEREQQRCRNIAGNVIFRIKQKNKKRKDIK